MEPKKNKINLSQEEAEKFLREQLNKLYRGKESINGIRNIKHLALVTGIQYTTLSEFKNNNYEYTPSDIIIKCLTALGYKNIVRIVETSYHFEI